MRGQFTTVDGQTVIDQRESFNQGKPSVLGIWAQEGQDVLRVHDDDTGQIIGEVFR